MQSPAILDRAADPVSKAMRQLRRAALAKNGAGLTDGQLLEHFLARRDEAAFASLVHRHGPMVFGVCRRLLGNFHDAEDAFQAAFLVLARKAASIRPRDMVANWLYGVAYRTASKAKIIAMRRQSKEKQIVDMPHPSVEPSAIRPDWYPLLDQELKRLPDKLRVPILLCDLEGRTRREAARRLQVPDGTLSNRLAAGRRILARRLASRGVSLGAGGIAALIAADASAAVPAALELAAVNAGTVVAAGGAAASVVSAHVVTLTQGVLQTMWLTNIKVATVALTALALIGTGTGLLRHPALADKPAAKAATPKGKGETDTSEVAGILKEVDPAKNTITILYGSKKLSGEKTFTLAGDCKLFLDDGTGDKLGFQEGKLADLTDGISVTLKLSADQKEVVRLWAEGPVFQGTLKAVDIGNNSVRIETTPKMKGEAAVDKTFPVLKNARIFIDDGTTKDKSQPLKEETLADLAVHVNAVVFVKLSADRKVVGNIAAEGPTVTGKLKAVDAAKNAITVTISVRKGDPEVDRTFAVADNARVSVDDAKVKDKSKPQNEARLADLPAGANVIVRLSLDQQSAIAIRAEGTTFYGALKAVDLAKNSIVVWDKINGEKTFTLDKDAAILLDGKNEAGKITDVPIETVISLKLSADQKTVQGISAFGPTVHGVVKGPAGDGHITIADKLGENTFPLGKDVPIFIEDQKDGKLSDLIEGSVVQLRQSVDKTRVLEVHGEGPSFHGVVKEVDPDSGTITITIGMKAAEDKTFAVTRKTAIATGIYGLPLKLSDLRAGKEIALRLAIDQKAAARITVLGE
jgi:RNA polymerase sigma factor (sigma-70 family)